MYHHLSRRLFRELAPDIAERSQHPRVLHACERTVERLVHDHRHFARPAASLFSEIRWCFPLAAQERVLTVVERHLGELRERLRRDNQLAFELTGVRPRCQAETRRGRDCGHAPDPATGYCSRHRHLADDALALSA